MIDKPPTGQKSVRELLYCWGGESLDVLVPKKRGTGFLAVPWGHHANKGLSRIEQDLRCDICGLDGYLLIDCGLKVTCYLERRAEFAGRAMALLSAHYGVPFREIGVEEFFNFVEKTQSVHNA